MEKCKHCGNKEKSKWNLEGFVCSNCVPNCIKCGSDNIYSSYKSKDIEGFGEIVWCYSCGQIMPIEHIEQDASKSKVDGLPDEFNKQEYIGNEIRDFDVL